MKVDFGSGSSHLPTASLTPAQPGATLSQSRVRTLADLAALAKVNVSTASRALADSRLVGPATRLRIQKLAREHGFNVNQAASRLRRRRTGTIGIVVPLGHDERQHFSDPFFLTLFGLLADRLNDRGFDIMVMRVVPNDAGWLERIVNAGLTDGTLLLGQSDQEEAILRVSEAYLPLVVWGQVEPHQPYCAVGTDNLEGGRLVARHLIAQGASRLAFLGDVTLPELGRRFEGVCAEASRCGLPEPIPFKVSLTMEVARETVAQLFETLRDFDGIACASDIIAQAVVMEMEDRGVAVPQDVRVTGFDDLAIAANVTIPLTTIRQRLAAAADAMVAALMGRLEGDETASTTLHPELVCRASA